MGMQRTCSVAEEQPQLRSDDPDRVNEYG
jgi:hypothetical protein